MDMDRPSREGELIAVVRELVRELAPQRLKRGDVTLASRLDRDLGIDSLARTELVLRIERSFRVRLPVTEVAEMDSVADLLKALEHAAPGGITAHAPDVAVNAATPLIGQPDHARTLTEMLDWHVAEHPDHIHVTVLEDENTVLGTMSYRDLQTAARAVAQGLISRDIVPGDRIAMMLPTGTDFFASFFGILYAGAVPVPIYPPARMAQLEEHMRRQIVILRNAGSRMLITVPEGRALAVLLRSQVETLEGVETVATLSAQRHEAPLPPLNDPDALGLMQYTSGSTGDPKGVMLTHHGLLENIRSMGHAMEATSADVFVSWLPLYHDMGLIGAWLGCCYFGPRLYVMSPISFLVRPATWLWTMHKYRATFSGGPNFAFELCASRIDEKDLEGLDLSALRFIVDGAEPISPQTLRRFDERFQRYGMDKGVVDPRRVRTPRADGHHRAPLHPAGRGRARLRAGRRCRAGAARSEMAPGGGALRRCSASSTSSKARTTCCSCCCSSSRSAACARSIPIVTAFTVAHSITLIASAYQLAPGALWFPPLIETLIAMTIFYMALENIVGVRPAARWVVTFAFGLVHGFGFSFVLEHTLQFAGSHLLTSLLAFNIGVELGQLLVLAILVPLLNLLFKHVVAERMGTIILSVIVGHTAGIG